MTDDASPLLAWAEDGSPRSGRFGDVYFSKDDGLAETRAVFLAGCGLPEAWADRPRFTVAELGFGTGLNIIALLDLWRRHRPEDGRLNVFSVEGFPLTAEEAVRALAAWPELADVAAFLIQAWPDGSPGFHRIELPSLNAVIDLAIGEAAWGLSQWSGRADAWFLDGFSPALNPGMWTPEVLGLVAARSAPDARLATFTVAGAVRRGLQDHGFTVEKKPGHGRKRERLEARLSGKALAASRPSRIAVVGGGIAGASVARALKAMGLQPVLFEKQTPGGGASGFPASLVTPRLDAGDRLIAALHAQALRRAGALYRETNGAVLAEGVLQLEQTPRDAMRFDKIAAQNIWARGAMERLDASACSDHLGEDVETGGLLMRHALAVQPRAVLSAWLEGVEQHRAEVGRIERHGEGWRLYDADGEILTEVDAVILTAGAEMARLWPEAPLSPVAGQADWIDGPTVRPTAWGGYAVPTGSGLLFGATHDRGVSDPTASDEASARNLATLAARLPNLAAKVGAAPRTRRTAVRATTPDRLPLAGAVTEGLYVLGGMGSRGFCVAPLLGEHVAALAGSAPSPLPTEMVERLRPDRFTTT